MGEAPETRRRVAARDALTTRTRTLTAVALGVSAVLSGLFAGLAAASTPGHKLLSGTSSGRTRGNSAAASTAIPPLPAAPGPGNVSGAVPSAPTPAPAPAPTQSPPAVVSGGS